MLLYKQYTNDYSWYPSVTEQLDNPMDKVKVLLATDEMYKMMYTERCTQL